jgi:hypothetical protein
VKYGCFAKNFFKVRCGHLVWPQGETEKRMGMNLNYATN